MKTIYKLTDKRLNDWEVEYNSDLPISAIRHEKMHIALLSAGNKYFPPVPVLQDGEFFMHFSVNFAMAQRFEMTIALRYDIRSRRGEAIHFVQELNSDFRIESGNIANNIFTGIKTLNVPKPDFSGICHLRLKLNGGELSGQFNGIKFKFSGLKCNFGRFAISRGHFFDILKIKQLKIQGDLPPSVPKIFNLGIFQGAAVYPINCRVKLYDYGDCMQADLTFSGGVRDTDVGEGNYHVMKADLIDNLYFKAADRKYILKSGQIVLVNSELAPDYFYKILHKKTAWPFHKKIFFLKVPGNSTFAIGAEKYQNTTAKTLEQTPSETIFTLNGKILFSGEPGKIEFISQFDKAVIKRLPIDDPRYEAAVEFARNNHYFLPGEPIKFTVKAVLPILKIVLENAFFEPIRELKPNEIITDLPPGVYHYRAFTLDKSDYCAFEVMGEKIPAPQLSGLPYLYDSRTETRGLITDSFDPWHGKSVDEGHYMSCTNFLPPAARKFDMIKTIHAYGREYFLWLSSRCCTNWQIDENADLIAQADYVNITDALQEVSVLWPYDNFIQQWFEEFTGEQYSIAGFHKLASENWVEWLDFFNTKRRLKRENAMAKLRKINPSIRRSQYGPAHIYAAHYKGREFVAYLGHKNMDANEIGFWQYEDYPFACRYEIYRGTYFLTACLQELPHQRIYPEIYTLGIQGCPDGAVHFAHPPFGLRLSNNPQRIRRRIFDYAFASGYFDGKKFNFWREIGFQACGFNRERYEVLIKAMKVVNDFPPVRPVKSIAFVYSDTSWRTAERIITKEHMDGIIIDVRKTAAECVPFAYENARKTGLPAGFQCDITRLKNLDANQVDLLVLPPLTGVPAAEITEIRRLYNAGVNLLCFEDCSGLEDLFGVKETGIFTSVHKLTSDFGEEFCEHPKCSGKYAVDGAEILINAEIPVLSCCRQRAAFFNVPPTLVREDQLHERLGYGLQTISKLINLVTRKVLIMLARPDFYVDYGSLIAFESGDNIVLIISNPGESETILPILHTPSDFMIKNSDVQYSIINNTTYQFKVPQEFSAVIIGTRKV